VQVPVDRLTLMLGTRQACFPQFFQCFATAFGGLSLYLTSDVTHGLTAFKSFAFVVTFFAPADADF
jgi:hypothetical protein